MPMPTLLDIIDPEKFLKFGFPGLVAIFALLLFYLFRKQFSVQLDQKDFLLKISPFLILTILLLGMVGFSIYSDRKLQNDNSFNRYEHTIDSLHTELLICHGRSPATESAILSLGHISYTEDSLDNKINSLQHEIRDKKSYLTTEAVIRIANTIERLNIFTSEGKGGWSSGYEYPISDSERKLFIRHKSKTEEEYDNKYKLSILRAVLFQNVSIYGADTSILRNALLILKKRRFENINFDMSIDNILVETQSLLSVRRAWLNEVILKLQQAQPDGGQHLPHITVPLPKEVWIINKPYLVDLSINVLPDLELEKELLDKKTAN